jgi:hypothetical protein
VAGSAEHIEAARERLQRRVALAACIPFEHVSEALLGVQVEDLEASPLQVPLPMLVQVASGR